MNINKSISKLPPELQQLFKKYSLPDTDQNKEFNFLLRAAILDAHVLGIEIALKATSK